MKKANELIKMGEDKAGKYEEAGKWRMIFLEVLGRMSQVGVKWMGELFKEMREYYTNYDPSKLGNLDNIERAKVMIKGYWTSESARGKKVMDKGVEIKLPAYNEGYFRVMLENIWREVSIKYGAMNI